MGRKKKNPGGMGRRGGGGDMKESRGEPLFRSSMRKGNYGKEQIEKRNDIPWRKGKEEGAASSFLSKTNKKKGRGTFRIQCIRHALGRGLSFLLRRRNNR